MSTFEVSAQERGAALIWWVIVLMVLTVIGGLGTYYNYDLYQKEIETSTKNKADADAALQDVITRNGWLKDLADVVGWAGTDGVIAKPRVDEIQIRIGDLQEKFASVQSSDGTLQQIIDAIVKDHEAVSQRAAQSKQSFDSEVQARADLQSQKDQLEQDKDREIADLQTKVRSEQDRTSNVSARLQSRIDDLQNKTSDLERRIAEQATDSKKERIDLTNQLVAKDAQMGELRNKLVKLEREPHRPDGAVIDASADLVWIDAGSKHGLKRGTRFDVFEYGKGKTKNFKGEVQVREVRDDVSVCAVVSTLDQWNPISAGDQIANPYYDREKTPEFVFLGIMPGRFGNDEMRRLLNKNGATVASAVSASTDFLVVGAKPPTEDDSLPLEESELFQAATRYGVEIITGRELERLLRY